MRFDKLKEQLGNKYSVKAIKKAIEKITPKKFKNKKGTLIELIKSNLSNPRSRSSD